MRYRQLGSSDLQVSEISLGSWMTFDDSRGLERNRAVTEAAFDAGITFFDTANVYGQGQAESAWGEILPADRVSARRLAARRRPGPRRRPR